MCVKTCPVYDSVGARLLDDCCVELIEKERILGIITSKQDTIDVVTVFTPLKQDRLERKWHLGFDSQRSHFKGLWTVTTSVVFCFNTLP